MFSKFALIITGLMLTVSSVGCCCLGGYPYGTNYRSNYGGGGCPPCNNGCAPAGAGYPAAYNGAFYQGADPSQTAYAGGISQTAFVPMQPGYAPTQSAFMPQSTALAPIQGQPINLGFAPVNSLPVY